MTDRHMIDGRATGRQQLLHMLRDVCNGVAALCDQATATSAHWQDRAKPAIKACAALQRGLIVSHPHLADQLHIVVAEIQIALAAQSDNALFAARVQKVRDAVLHLQRLGSEM